MTIKRFLRRTEVLKKIGISKTSLYNLERAGSFPKHFMLTPRCAVWDEGAVDAWMASRAQMPTCPAAAPGLMMRGGISCIAASGRGRARKVAS